MWRQWLNALLGVVTIVVAFMGLTGDTLAWTLGIVGAAVLILSVWSAFGEQEEVRQLRHQHQ